LIVMFAAISFVFNALIGQLPSLITGLEGMAYVFTIVYSIIQSVAYLMYGGRRWRILAQALLLSLLYFLFMGWTLPVAMATITNMFIVDLIFNSFHEKFKRDNRLFRWILALQVYSWTTHSFIVLAFLLLFVPMDAVIALFVPLMSVMLPIIIIEAIAGSYIGYKIYGRVEKISEQK
jgi:hypothetical protein